jgi:hypothetical protein
MIKTSLKAWKRKFGMRQVGRERLVKLKNAGPANLLIGS